MAGSDFLWSAKALAERTNGGDPDRGIALIVATMAMALIAAVGAALVLLTTSEAQIAANFRAGHEVLYAADAAGEWTLSDLASQPDWSVVAAGRAMSAFVDGAPTGTRALADGSTVDLDAVVAADPAWHPYAFGLLRNLVPPSTQPSPAYVIVLVSPGPPGGDRLRVRAEAFGPHGARRAIELGLSRDDGSVRADSWAHAPP